MYNQLRRYREYLDSKGGRHRLLAEAAKKTGEVTLNKDFINKVEYYPNEPNRTNWPLHQKTQVGKTFFKEVKIAPPFMNEAIKLYSQTLHRKEFNLPFRRLTQIIEKYWESDIFHVDLHSSGYDSRLISYILLKLKRKHGEGWLGDILFLCWEPQGALFKDLMKWMGWKNFHVYREGIGVDYRAEVVDFKKVWRWVNDYSLPHSSAGPAVEDAVKRGLIPKGVETCLVSGLSSRQFLVGPYRLNKYRNIHFDDLITDTYNNNIYATWSAIPFTKAFIPFLNVELQPSAASSKWRQAILEKVSMKLRNMPRFPHRDEYVSPNWLNAPEGLSEKTRIKTAKDFNDSWYAKETGQPEVEISPNLDNYMTQNDYKWWRNYVLASTCEYLINEGVKIKI